jgi:signal transduction histidine kinase
VWADSVQLNQVFTNLVDNAIKYMGDGHAKRIAIHCSLQGERFRFAVSDTGCGIALKDQEKVFRLFARAAANGSAGEGVGLATVRAIVNRHGGRIWVDSTPGEGSTFFFTLPRKPSEADTVAASTPVSGTRRAGGEESQAHVH